MLKNQPDADISLNIFRLARLPIYSNCTRTIQELFIHFKQNIIYTYTIHAYLITYLILFYYREMC